MVLGGGTGTFTKTIVEVYPNLYIEFIESSPAMLKKAKIKLADTSNLSFNPTSTFQLLQNEYDAVVAPFFFDQFTEKQVLQIIETIEKQCAEPPRWFITDFQIVPNARLVVWNRLRMQLTIWFFRKVTNYPLTKLPELFEAFKVADFQNRTVFLSPNQLVRSSVFYRE